MNYPNRIISVDFETTGLVPAYDFPTSIAAIVMEDGEPTGEAFVTPIKPSMKMKLSMEAFAVQGGDDALDHDLIAAKLRKMFPTDAPTQLETMKQLADWCESVDAYRTANVAQRASFDWGFYHNKLECFTSVKHGGFGPVWICTKTMARVLFPGAKASDISLNGLAAALGIEGRTSDGHDAREDALLCGRVYFRLKEELKKR